MRKSKNSLFIGAFMTMCALCIAPLAHVSAAPSERAQEVSNSQSPNSAVNRARRASEDATTSARKAVAQAKVVRQEKVRVACENRQNTIQNKLRAFGGSADKNLTRLNVVFDKIVNLKEVNSINVVNYEALLSDVVVKQGEAKSAVTTLQTLADNVDCTNSETAVRLSTVKTTTASARDALKAYKTSLKTLLSAISQATTATTTEPVTEGTE